MQRQHLRAQQVLAGSQAGGQLELVGAVAGLHDLVGPLAADLVLLVDLEPARTDAVGLAGIVHGAVQEVGNGTRVAGVVPLHLDGVALGGGDRLDARGHLGAPHVARHVVGGYVRDGAVGRGHPDADLVAWCLVVDPELVEVLVGGSDAQEGRGEDGLGEHIDDLGGLGLEVLWEGVCTANRLK